VVEDGKAFEAQPEIQCPGTTRVARSALLGTFDFLHISEAAKAALLASPFWVVSTQAFAAIPFSQFKQIVEEL
jgi:hypothetical protein